MILTVVILYMLLLLLVSRLTKGRGDNAAFFRGNRQSKWWMVAFGMIGASISGITFVSVPGMVLHSGMTYLQMCMGFIFGYFAVAFILLPIYYKLNLTTIYTYLKSINNEAYKTGSGFFIVSKLLGSAAKFYVPCFIISQQLGWPIAITIVFLLTLVWIYTRQGGIRTLVWTDTIQTTCMLVALCLIIWQVITSLDPFEPLELLNNSKTQVFEFKDWSSPQYFWKQFVSGIFIVIVMTGLDQDMMQKNLTCKTLKDAQKDMCTYGFAFVPVNLLFLGLGVLLTMLCTKQGIALPEKGDDLLPMFAEGRLGMAVLCFFTIGIIASSFSTIDSALTSLTTSFCIDICERPEDEKLRKKVHSAMTIALVLSILMFHYISTSSLIEAIYTLVSYTYGPLLGLFLFAILSKNKILQSTFTNRKGTVLIVCLIAPLICFLLNTIIPKYTGYHFSYELLLLNGLLTLLGLRLALKRKFL